MARPIASARITGYLLDIASATVEEMVEALNLSTEIIETAVDGLVKDKTLTATGVRVIKYSLTDREKTEKKVGASKAGRIQVPVA
jgi:translation initiation factor 2 alpha subunit (eIF-2alpha)